MRLASRIYVVPGLSGVAIGAGLSNGPIAFRWPERHFVTGLLVVPQSGSAADLADLHLSIADEDHDALFAFRGGDVSAPGLGLFGGLSLPFVSFPHVRPLALQRPVVAGDVWRFTLENTAGGAVTPLVLLYAQEPS